MRKLVSVLLVCLLAICVAVPVCADGEATAIDLEAMSLEELLELHEAVEAAISAKNGSVPSPIYKGIYVAGDSITVGKYTITCPDDGQSFQIATFADQETYEKAFAEQDESLASFQSYVNVGETVFVQVDEGAVLLVSGEGVIQPVVLDFAP
jgi:hypothetical protein